MERPTPPPSINPPDDALAEAAVALAAELLQTAKQTETPAEQAQARKIAGMMDDIDGKTLTMQLSDQAFRSANPARVAKQIHYLLQKYGVPRYFSEWEQFLLRLGDVVGQVMPAFVVPFIVQRLRQETQAVLLPGEPRPFERYLRTRRATGIRLNINHLGEAILGEGEAAHRFDAYLELLTRADVEYISVKISSIFSQINLIAFDHTVEQIKTRLRTLYRQAMKYTFTAADGTQKPKFINLDMEEYRDLHLTVAAFKGVLDEPEFRNYRAGIVLQAYLPDAFPVQRDLTAWAQARVASGGAPIKLRIVKGANLAMERVDASIHGWEQAPYTNKPDVDANYKRMVTYGCTPERAAAVNLGVASHNLFDISYALLLRDKHNLQAHVELEMLEGMANHQARAVQARADGLLLYAPVVKREDFHSAIAYLVRRLDENTAPENFLHDLFKLEVGGELWLKQRELFQQALDAMPTVYEGARRQQNRLSEQPTFDVNAPFHNEPDTDFSLPQNQQWVRQIFARWGDAILEDVPLQIDGTLITTEKSATAQDPSRPNATVYRYSLATPAQIDTAFNTAQRAQVAWGNRPHSERKALLVRCAETLARRRADLLGVMMRDTGKTIEQGDPEVSEAIDFANYYARSFDALTDAQDRLQYAPLGVVLVTPPWNFPLAIPAGGVLAALAAGNSVILKPAPEAVLVGWHLVSALWDAGIPRDVLQFVPTTDDEVGRGLVTDARVNAVILTGGYNTARMFLNWQPNMRLFAETSGKNALIITSMADRDQAIKDLVKSAFGHAGQKCSAASLAILEAEVYDDPAFLRQLKDAAESLHVGVAHEPQTIIAPVIRPPDDKLRRALTTLEAGETWLLEPRNLHDNPNLWTPGIKLGVQPNSFFHMNECFGPVLGLMRADNLDHAIDLANAVDYGLTGGIHSLDEREVQHWQTRVQVGNAYANRVTTGAIVQRQPFGGWKRSAFGYAKAGGENYTLTLGTWTDHPADPTELIETARSRYAQAWQTLFSQARDVSGVLGEANLFRYLPLARVIVWQPQAAPAHDVARVQLAAQTCGVPVLAVHTEAEALAALNDPAYQYEQRLRVFNTPLPPALQAAANEAHVMVIDAPVVSSGRLELRHYLKEQALSLTTHRYGNILR